MGDLGDHRTYERTNLLALLFVQLAEFVLTLGELGLDYFVEVFAKFAHDRGGPASALITQVLLHVGEDDLSGGVGLLMTFVQNTFDAFAQVPHIEATHVGEFIDVTRDRTGYTQVNDQ